jgi:hypothetical protein
MASADTSCRRWFGSSIWLHDVCSERSGSRRLVGSPRTRTRHLCRTATGQNRTSLMRPSPVRRGWSNIQLHGSRKLSRRTCCLGCGHFSCGNSGVRHCNSALHESRSLIQSISRKRRLIAFRDYHRAHTNNQLIDNHGDLLSNLTLTVGPRSARNDGLVASNSS